MPRLPLNEYAAVLCAAVRAYDFPAVTCEFERGGDQIVRKSCRGSMFIVEKYIHDLLCSANLLDVKDGLSNVLYWGYAQTGFQEYRVNTFRTTVQNTAIQEFAGLVKEPPLPGLLAIDNVNFPGFGMSFTTKILMFLDPTLYPVLDTRIGRLAVACNFPPLLEIVAPDGDAIPINQTTARAYEKWACWCREIAELVNGLRVSRRHDLRAVDVERALFTLAGNDDDAGKACAILRGPEGWTLDGP